MKPINDSDVTCSCEIVRQGGLHGIWTCSGVLGGASEASEDHDAPFYIGEGKDENLAPKAERDKIPFACGASTGARFWGNVAFGYCAISDMVPRVCACPMRGITEYGSLVSFRAGSSLQGLSGMPKSWPRNTRRRSS